MTGARAIAAAQTVPVRGDVDANLDEHLRLVRAAAERGARVLVFPELSLTGYELDLAEELAFTERDPRLAPLVAAAASRAITLVVGAPVRLAARLHIGAFVLAPDRSVELYTKRHLGAFGAGANPGGPVPPAEASVFHPGDRDPLIRFDGHTAAVALCADTGQPGHPARAAERGARTYLAGTFTIPDELDSIAVRLRGHAVRHSMAVVFANYGGPTAGLPSGGGSAIWSERGALLTRLDDTGAGVALAIEEASGWRAEAHGSRSPAAVLGYREDRA